MAAALPRCWSRLWTAAALAIATASGVAYFLENLMYTRHIKWLPTAEMEMVVSLQTENGFYFSYYRELLHARTFVEGLKRIIWDARSEYPDVINALRRFNLYQEVFLALAYRTLTASGLQHVVSSWDFFRYAVYGLNGVGQAALALLAAEVSGNAAAGVAFYLYAWFNRFQMSRLGTYASLNLREQYGIPLLWLQTLCLWHLLRGFDYARSGGDGRRQLLWASFGICTFLFLLVWQFSPFLLLLQLTALYFVYLVLGYRALRPLLVGVVNTHLVCVGLAFLCFFCSPYLLTSPFLYQLVALKVALSVFSRRCASHGPASRRSCGGPWLWLWRRLVDIAEGLVALVVFAAVMKALAPFATADTHVYEILCTKAKDVNELLPSRLRLPPERLPECAEPSFNARLYLIMGVFKTLEKDSLDTYKNSSASPAAFAACAAIFIRWFLSSVGWSCSTRAGKAGGSRHGGPQVADETTQEAAGLRRRRGGKSGDAATQDGAAVPAADAEEEKAEEEDGEGRRQWQQQRHSEEAALLFFAVQFLLFGALGFLVNRLRVAFAPPMMVLAASCFGPRIWPLPAMLRHRRTWLLLLAVLVALFVAQVSYLWQKLPCVGDEGICGQLQPKVTQDGDLADLFSHINERLPARTPIMCSMNLAGSLRAFTNVSLVLHPQFESQNLRRRVQMAYELYHCGSEESFVRTMQRLKAEVVIFEYSRCFFTPYILDERHKNCNPKRHAFEDLMCVKLHANSRFFEIEFLNAGYAMFRLRKSPAAQEQFVADPEKRRELVRTALETPATWSGYVERCAQYQGRSCGPRLVELGATWSHLQRPKVAMLLRRIALEVFPDQGLVLHGVARHIDYEAKNANKAGEYYAKAFEASPNNPDIIREYLLWLTIVAQDNDAVRKLVHPDQRARKGLIPLASMTSTAGYELMCEAAVSAHQVGLHGESKKLWDKMVKAAPLSKCRADNLRFIYPKDHEQRQLTLKEKVWHYIRTGQTYQVTVHNSPGARLAEGWNFTLMWQ